MASIVTSLSQSFLKVPPAAIPAMLDCILSSTGLSPSSVFDLLLDAFPTLTQNIMEEDVKLDSDHCNYLSSFVVAFCHLLKKLGSTDGALHLFIWKIFIPMVKIVHEFDLVMLNQIIESLFNVVTETDSWGIVEATIVPLFLGSVGLTMGMRQNEESNVIAWGRHSYSSELRNGAEMDEEHMLSLSGSFPIPISFHILTLILDTALRIQQVARTSGSVLTSRCYSEKFACNLLWDLCNMTERLLLESSEHRSCTISYLLPIIFKAFVSQDSFQVSVHCETCVLSRKRFFMKIWKCCRTLFSLGSLERRDAYNILSLYLSFFSNIEAYEDAETSDGAEEFDIRAEKELWDELKGGLVDKEGLVRKQSLHILKTVLCINQGSQSQSGILEELQEIHSIPHSKTKRGQWAEKEAKSLGVGKICNSVKSDTHLNSQQQWESFFLLYEMLEEYGTHLVEAAWSNQVTLLLQFSSPHGNSSFISGGMHQNQLENSAEIFNWLSILWERGLCHDNPQVRCLIMQSFLGIEWKNLGNCEKSVPESFLLGPFIQGLNDPVQHRDFGVKGVYSSTTIEGAANFLHQYTSYLTGRKGVEFLRNLASLAKQLSFGRAGLMGLAECTASVAGGVQAYKETEVGWSFTPDDKTDLLGVLRYVIESSKQHFNPNYRLRVCQKVLEAAASVVCTFDVPLEILLHFIATLPREFTDYGGLLRVKVQEWLLRCSKKHCSANCCGGAKQRLKSLCDFPERFISCHNLVDASVTFDDEDVDAWEFEAKRWARVLFLSIKEEHHLVPICAFIKNHCKYICKHSNHLDWIPVKFIILTLSLVLELQIIEERAAEHGVIFTTKTEVGLPDTVPQLSCPEASFIVQKFANFLLLILEDLVSLATFSSSIFSTAVRETTILPGSIRGKLGGPSQRRLSSSTTTALLQAIMSMKAVASISSWCAQFRDHVCLGFAFSYMWEFFWKTISSQTCDSETGAEICLAAYEALAHVLRALASTFSPLSLDLIKKHDQPSPQKVEGEPLLDFLVLSFLQNINDLLADGVLTRTRRAVLLNWKWLCLESLLSIPCYALKNEVHLEDIGSFFSDATVRLIFFDLVESLENAGEGSVLTMLRSVRLTLELFASGRLCLAISSYNGVDAQMIWRLVRSSWIMHVSCNKRRVAPIAALLSSVLHSSVFSDEAMHVTDGALGPLKWFIENLLKEGMKSPRTIRLAALHLTGMWLSNPRTIKYYMEELKLLSLYGSVAFDEDFEAELTDNLDAKTEVSLLAKSPDPELTEAFINTELYARVSVAVLFHKLAHLADLGGSIKENEDFCAAIESGKLFLLELLDCAVNDKDVAKELYKKYSGVHRRKIRAWQMICILSQFVDQDIVEQVSHFLHLSLYRNNLPSVRQYLETFAVHLCLKFPSLVDEQLVPVFRDYDMRAQALSSYVFIAANVILHASEAVQSRHLDVLLPPIIPLLTSHHHSLRGFTQLLVHNVVCKIYPISDSSLSEITPLEKRCFEDLKAYLARNSDCLRLRASMEGYLEAFDPNFLVSPAGIFIDRVEELEFECVPTSLMEQVLAFLNTVREELRCSMANDVVTIRNESLRSMEISSNANQENLHTQQPTDISLDFQKKITISKHGKQEIDSSSFLGDKESYKQLEAMEKEDQLLSNILHHRSMAMNIARGSRQHIIIVASLIDRIPNLAGLARTCEVFKASGLAIADTSILRDKQFQLISVTAEKWVPIIEVPVNSVKVFLEKKKREGFSILGLEQTANSITLDRYKFPQKMVLVLGREKEGIPVDIIHVLDSCIEIPQLGVVRSLNVHVSGAIALWEYTKQQRSQ